MGLFFRSRRRAKLKYEPHHCRGCELMGNCRDKDLDWKHRNGCYDFEKKPVNYDIPARCNIQVLKYERKVRPVKRVLIMGCRAYENYPEAYRYINRCLAGISDEYRIVVVSGGVRLADRLGHRFASDNGFEVEFYRTDWDRHGKDANLQRNRKEVDVSDCVICLWDGESDYTGAIIDYARQRDKPLMLKMI